VTRLLDLSMPVHRDMLTFPRVPPPTLVMYESWSEFAERIGAAAQGADWLTASYLVIQNDHVGSHCDAVKHLRGPDAPGVEGIPLQYCYSDGVVLDFRDRPSGYRILPGDVDAELARIGYTLKERDIVLIHTGAGAYNTEERYRTDHCGMTAEATRHLIAQGVRMMGIDAITFDPPVWAMFEGKHFWEAHRVMLDEDYWHLENLMNLDQLPSHGFKLSVFPIKWIGTTAAPVRAVAILEEE
jgi:kynurenine formamidase